jgi:hypothetical protein
VGENVGEVNPDIVKIIWDAPNVPVIFSKFPLTTAQLPVNPMKELHTMVPILKVEAREISK